MSVLIRLIQSEEGWLSGRMPVFGGERRAQMPRSPYRIYQGACAKVRILVDAARHSKGPRKFLYGYFYTAVYVNNFYKDITI